VSDDGKPMTWTRYTVRVVAQDPAATYYAIKEHVPEGARFKIRSMGVTESEVRLVAEYTAAGANGDDVKRRLMAAGIDRSRMTVSKVASVETDWAFNADLVDAVTRVPSPFV
jgi:hypothetical protein